MTKNIAFYGSNGRGEGPFALIFLLLYVYYLHDAYKRKCNTYCDGLLLSLWGFVNVICILQITDITSSFADSKGLRSDYISNVGNINAASGYVKVQCFWLWLWAFALMTAITYACICESNGRRLIYAYQQFFPLWLCLLIMALWHLRYNFYLLSPA